MKEEVMVLIDWCGNSPCLVTTGLPVSGGVVYVAYGVIQRDLEPFEAFLNNPENPVEFEEIDGDLLNFLFRAAKKALDNCCIPTMEQHASVN